MRTSTIAPPASMQRLLRDQRGLPVPHVASWSSETWGVARAETLLPGYPMALFTRGRQGRGKPMFDVVNEQRQRRAVLQARCQVCDYRLLSLDGGPLGWLPKSVFERESLAHLADGTPVTHEPLCCFPCATWVAAGCCVLKRHGPEVVRITRFDRVLQIVDPSRAPVQPHRLVVDLEPERARLGVIARRAPAGGLVGFVKLAVREMEPE